MGICVQPGSHRTPSWTPALAGGVAGAGEMTCGRGDAGTRADLPCKFSPQSAGFSQSPSVGQGLGTASPKPSVPSADITETGQAGGCAPAAVTWAAQPLHAVGAPPPRGDSSAGAEPLVPASRVSACAASGSSSRNSSGRRCAPRPAPRQSLPCACRTVSWRFGHVKSVFWKGSEQRALRSLAGAAGGGRG